MYFNRALTISAVASAAVTLFSVAQSRESQVGMGLRKILVANEFVAHEWGTFTSVQGSDGVDRPGLHHGDEALPHFVHCPLGFRYSRCLSVIEPSENSPLSVTQRMETPVIYFYAGHPLTIDVTIDFPQGLITEWYPKATSYSPQPDEVSELRNGTMTWRTEVLTEEVNLPAVSSDEIWQAQREVDSNQIRVGDEAERFIFYRGIGRFSAPFVVTSDTSNNLSLSNSGSDAIPSIVLLHFDGDKGAFRLIEGLNAESTLTLSAQDIPEASSGIPAPDYLEAISTVLEARLVSSGLYPLEARAMVNTWKRSYFLTPGLRALYILPRTWTDELVPLHFSPAPKNLERVFVGRTEIFTASEEQALLAEVRTAIAENIEYWRFPLEKLGRFSEPKLWRLKSLAENDPERNYIEALIAATFLP